MLTPEQRVLRARIAAYASHKDHTGSERTAAARAGFAAKLEARVREQDPGLSDIEIARRVEILRREHMARMAFAASRKRSRRRMSRPAQGPPHDEQEE